MSADIITAVDPFVGLTQSLISLASGGARQSTVLTNSLQRPAANVYYLIKSNAGTLPTAGGIYEVFLYRRQDSTTTPASASCVADDAAGIADAGITIENSQLIGTIVVTATLSKNFWGVFTTANLGVLGPSWGTSIRNSSGAIVDAVSEANFAKQVQTYRPRSQ